MKERRKLPIGPLSVQGIYSIRYFSHALVPKLNFNKNGNALNPRSVHYISLGLHLNDGLIQSFLYVRR